jgi:hypothetical protein
MHQENHLPRLSLTCGTPKPLAERLKVTIKEEKIAGVTGRRVTPANINPANRNRLFVNTHGGVYVVNNRRAGPTEAILIAHRANIPVHSIDYRMPPGGSSAGEGLILASTHKLIDLGIPVTGALFLGSNHIRLAGEDGTVTRRLPTGTASQWM